MRKIKVHCSSGIFFLPTRFLTLDIHRQCIWNPARCQRITVSGVTKICGCFQPDQNRRAAIQNRRSKNLGRALGCWRFDREVVNGRTIKHHVQTLCALNDLDFKQRATHAYAHLFMAVAQLGLGDDAISQIFRRMALNVMARNCDDHTKNFSFILRQGRNWELAPAYDVTHAYNPKGEWMFQHLMSVNGKFKDSTRAVLLAEADQFGVRRPNDLMAEVRAAVENWPSHAGKAGLSDATANAVAADFRPQ
jgi:hypothetical protein